MQLYNMDCTGRRSNQSERDPDLGEDLSRDVASDDDIRDCDSIDADHHVIRATRLNVATLKRQHSSNSNNKNRNIHNNNHNSNNNNNSHSNNTFVGDMSFGGNAGSVSLGVGSGMGVRSPDHHGDLQMSHHHQFPTNHPLNALSNFMGISGLHGIPNLPHNDVLEKLKMQVRDFKEQDYAAAAHAAAFGQNLLPSSLNPAFSLPPTSIAQFEHRAQSLAAQAGGGSSGIGGSIGVANGNSQNSQHTGGNNVGVSGASCLTNGGNGLLGGANGSGGNGPGMGSGVGGVGGGGVGGASSGNGGFSFTSPTAPSSKDVNPASNSSTSSEASNSSQQNNAWSFEEQYKQVRQLYEINDDPKRKEFLDDLFSFMQKRGTPINRLPIMAKSVLDLYELYNLVIARGGLVDVINKKLWQEIIKGLHLPSSITSAAFTLRTQYMKYLYPYECDKKNLSTPVELQAAIDGNRREGRRSSYGQYEAMHAQLQMPQIGRPQLPGGIQQMSPLALVTHAANNQQVQAAAAAAAAHHRLMAPSFGQIGQMPNLVSHELEQRMVEYIKLMQVKKEQHSNAAAAAAVAAAAAAAGGNVAGVVGGDAAALARLGAPSTSNGAHLKQQQRQRSASPEAPAHEAMNALDISRVALWQMYHNNTSPPVSMNASPQGSGAGIIAGVNAMGVPNLNEQNSEALNLSDSPPNINNIKREREHEQSPEPCDRDDFHNQSPPVKRSALNFPAGFYLPSSMAAAAAAAAANFHQQNNNSNNHLPQDSDGEDGEDGDDDADTHNAAHNSMAQDVESNRPALNGHHHQHLHHHLQQLHHLPHGLQMPHHQHLVKNASGNQDKSDDSALENSPSTSAASTGGVGADTSNGNNACGDNASGHISPVSTKKKHLPNQQNNGGSTAMDCSSSGAGRAQSNSPSLGGVEDALNLLSGMQFRVSRNGTNANGEQQLVVNLELNGVNYSGVLIANTANNSNDASPSRADPQQKTNEANENNESVDATAEEAKNVSGSGTSGADGDIEDEDMADLASTTSNDETTPRNMSKNDGNGLSVITNKSALNDSNVNDAVMSAS
ncbi:protein dead ringer isoform X3 [Bactrocera dorsalis]|uniref:Protein dead ringer isoform X3 n=1 Tax=Bactrocera dorsalis TaxID=27457 RepID=A0A6I9V9I4_BACDO|nr:protein dead ringer isoform X3 [Bactrocera dorsalis]